MQTKIKTDIQFVIQREMLLALLKEGTITEQEYDKALNKLRKKHNCKLIVTSPNF